MNLFLQLAPFALFLACIPVCASVVSSLQKEIYGLRKEMEKQWQDRELVDQRTIAECDELKQGLQRAEERAGVLVPPLPAKSGLNLNKRSQVMRLSRHGENAENIAAALSLPRNEVELLLKVQRIVLSSASEVTS